MIIKIALCLLTISFFAACQSTTSTAGRQTLEQRMAGQYASNAGSVEEPAPPAEGPEDIPAEGPVDPIRNPALLPTPLLRSNAAAGL
jgi:hypothetical protein